jgi:ABC-type transporter Mla subunit MlaD
LRTRLKQLAGVLQATKGQLNQAIEHRQDYEDALEQTVQIADTLSLMLPLVTDQLDGRLDEEDRTLTDLGRNLDDVGRQLPAYERTATHLFGAGRVLACLVAAIVGLHGFYLTFGSLRTRPDCKQTALRKCMDLSHNAIQHTMEPLSVSSFPAGRG